MPILRPSGPVLCALTLTGPDTRMAARPGEEASARELELLALLRSTAAAVSSALHF